MQDDRKREKGKENFKQLQTAFPMVQGEKPAEALAKGEPQGSTYDYEDRINMAVFPSLQVCASQTPAILNVEFNWQLSQPLACLFGLLLLTA